MTTALRTSLVAVVATAFMAVSAGPALGAFDHSNVEKTFDVGQCERIRDVAVVESTETLYVACNRGFFNGGTVIEKYDYNGNKVNFSAKKPYVSGNTIFEDPGSEEGTIGRIAVDSSGGPNDGLIYVCGDVNIDIFNPAGEFIGIVKQKTEGGAGNFNLDVTVGPDGYVYVTSQNPGGRISKYDLAWHEVRRLYTQASFNEPGALFMRIDTTGAAWVARGNGFFGETQGSLWKYEVDQFLTNISIQPSTNVFNSPELFESVHAKASPYISGPESVFGGVPLIPETNVVGMDVDWTDNDVYVDRFNRIETYSQGTPTEDAYRNAPDFGMGIIENSSAIDVLKNHKVFVAHSNRKITVFGPGNVVPDITTKPPVVDKIGHDTATVDGRVRLAGGNDITSCEVEYGLTAAYGTKKPCAPNPAAAPPASNFKADTDVSAQMTGLTPGSVYHYRFVAANSLGSNAGVDRTVVAAYVLKLNTLPATGIDTSKATLNGSFDPDGMNTTYHFEYGATTDYGNSTAEEAGGSIAGVKSVATQVSGLPSGRTFHYRIVATNENGTTYGPDLTFRTGSPPEIGGVNADELTGTTATVNARINPTGYATSYLFEYGTTSAYGQSIPVSPASIGAGTESVDVSQQLTGLQDGTTYHYRVVATNVWGTAVSPDTTFDFAPPSCPNVHVRQQTKSAYLPDCRAYEIVSPGHAGSILFFPSNFLWGNSSQQEYFTPGIWPVNTGLATSPPRFAYWGGLGQVEGIDAPNTEADMYMATRSANGWVTTLPGLTASETMGSSNKECSETLTYCIDHGTNILNQYDFAPYLFTSDGKKLGQLPTNVNAIPNTAYSFHGVQRFSGNGSHYVFSSTEYTEQFCGSCPTTYPGVAFAPGGVTTGIGSAYDNDIGSRSVTIVSKMPDGSDIQPDGEDKHAIEFPALSPDGSHILMQTKATNGPSHLFMRVDQSVSYDISRGAGVRFGGMTKDGSTVYFTTLAQLTPDDTDNSADLYMWTEAGDELTRISQGNGNGDGDDCHPAWTNDCDVVLVTPERLDPISNSAISAPGIDDVMAEESGDFYFYSPEVLDGTKPAVADERNLYVFRDGEPQFVAAFEPGTQINRMQIAPTGGFASWVTSSRMSPYDNDGFKEMYVYDAVNRSINCASCKPSGQPPLNNVEASSAGPFMTDDGRVFFSTKDALVPRDRNGEIIDVYEYVAGRPQLITSGVGSRDFTGGGELFNLLGDPQNIGLESVSADGTDVFFSTYESLVDQDVNGAFVKFYDARTNGGFPSEPALLPCAAADECHGADSSPPPPPTVSTGGNLGSGGNFEPAPPAKKKKKKKKVRKGKSKTKRHSKTGRNHG
jgi:hypothetical protein